MKKKTLALAAMMAVGGKAVAQNEATLDYDLRSLNEQYAALSANKKLQDSLKQATYDNIREYEDIYRQMQLGWDAAMIKGGDDAKTAKPQIKTMSMEMIDRRVGLMLSYCPELKVEEVEGFVNLLLNKANAQNKFRFGTKLPANVWDVDSDTRQQMISSRGDLTDLVLDTYILNKDNLQADFLSLQFLKELDKKYNQARAASIKNPNDEEKSMLVHYLLSDIHAISKLQKGIAAAKKQGIKFNEEDLKQAVIINSQARYAEIVGYDKSNDKKRHIVIESQNKIVDAVKYMGMADVALQSYSYNRISSENVDVKADTKTISWNMAKAISAKEGTMKG